MKFVGFEWVNGVKCEKYVSGKETLYLEVDFWSTPAVKKLQKI